MIGELDPFNGASFKDRSVALLTGGLLGISATPKTLYQILKGGPLSMPTNILEIIKDYKKSNKGVTNQPVKR